MAGVLARRDEGEGHFARAFSPTPLDYRLRRIAATETARAFNDERLAETRAHHEPRAGVFKVWSAVLDRRTCAYCFDRDGRTFELEAKVGESPPVHVCCRCVWEFVWVPHPERLEDIGLDLEAFKREMRDVIRERRVPSERHAAAFVRASMGRTRSPVVLTRKFAALGR
jgi:SPP1 gp7 family putative phage head morphogenesis protein